VLICTIKVLIYTLCTKTYLLKRYSPSDRFWTFFSESVAIFLFVLGTFCCKKKKKFVYSLNKIQMVIQVI